MKLIRLSYLGLFASQPPLATRKVRQPQTHDWCLVSRHHRFYVQNKVRRGFRCDVKLRPATKQPLKTTYSALKIVV